MKTITHPTSGQSICFGRTRPAPHLRTGHKMMSRYMGALPTAPTSFDWSTMCATAEANILGNDTLGDCTSAGAGHLIDIFTAGGGSPVAITPAQAIAFYSQSTGYVPGNPATDQGGDEVTVLTSWKQKGYDGKGGHAIAGFIQVDPTNQAELLAACYYFGGLYFGLELPDSYITPFPSSNGFVWGPGTPDPNNGHCIVGVGANAQGILINTWGMIGTLTYPAIAQLCADAAGGMVFAVVDSEWVNKQKNASPSGLNWAQIVADFDGIGGTVPAPAPSPAPGPSPTPPSGPVTLAQAQAWAAAGIQAGHPLQTRAQAVAASNAGLASHWPSGQS
jgi:hypothetical protein